VIACREISTGKKLLGNEEEKKTCFSTQNLALPFTLSYSIILEFKTCVIPLGRWLM